MSASILGAGGTLIRAFDNLVLVVAWLALVPSAAASKDWEMKGGQGMMKFVLIEKSKEGSEAVYRDAIRELCERGKYCYLHFWSDKRLVPTRLPMSDAEAEAEVANFTRNPKTNFERFLWNCRLNTDRTKCFR